MTVLVVAAALSVAFLALSLLAPAVLRPLNKVWFKFALLLNKIVSPVVMFILFALVIVPFGLIMQMRSDPLRKRRRAELASYWVDKRKGAQAGSMTQQF